MNIELEPAGYTEKLHKSVRSRWGSAEIYEVYSPSGRFIGYQVYRDGTHVSGPFQTLKGAEVCAQRSGPRAFLRRTGFVCS
jgi:hypothetical protein